MGGGGGSGSGSDSASRRLWQRALTRFNGPSLISAPGGSLASTSSTSSQLPNGYNHFPLSLSTHSPFFTHSLIL
jgi:hypothetical protein